jgi:hypothetical protein
MAPGSRRIRFILLSFLCLLVKPLDAFAVSKFASKRTRAPYLEATVSSSPKDTLTDNKASGLAVVLVHLGGCLISAIALCSYEDYDCAHLKPNGYLRPQAVRGLGEGYRERIEDWRQGDVIVNSNSDVSLVGIPSYNEVMQQHRRERVPSWDQPVNEQDVRAAVHDIFSALAAVNQLKVIADDYGWEDMQDLLRSPVLTAQMQQACSMLRRASFALSENARNEIGFDWGSCAWRHCGAEADAQESLAELYNLSGILEPFECRFILDIVERSLRDVLAVVPIKYYDQALDSYQPYQFKDAEVEESYSDLELIKYINEFRNPQWDDE